MEIWGGNHAVEDSISLHGLDAWVLSIPHSHAEEGGDIHYVSMCGSGRIARFAVADIAGHGPEVSPLAATLRGLMKKNINRIDQTRFARALNREFSVHGDMGSFATAILATYWCPTDQLIICNAGHPPPLWYRSQQHTWCQVVPDVAGHSDEAVNLPLGIIEPTAYHQFAVPLASEDLVLIYTDSLIEVCDIEGRILGVDGLQEIVGTINPAQPESFNRSLLEAIEAFQGSRVMQDDTTMLLLYHNGSDPPFPSVGSMVKSIGKLMGLVKM